MGRITQRAWDEANRDKRRAAVAKYRVTERGRLNAQTAYERRKRRLGTKNRPGILRSLLREKEKYWGGVCWMCGAAATEIDHVKPIDKGGAHILCNLRPACRPCNSRKAAKWPIDVEHYSWKLRRQRLMGQGRVNDCVG
jgi:5-methylcytosine-specific restriction endonuclease McrA